MHLLITRCLPTRETITFSPTASLFLWLCAVEFIYFNTKVHCALHYLFSFVHLLSWAFVLAGLRAPWFTCKWTDTPVFRQTCLLVWFSREFGWTFTPALMKRAIGKKMNSGQFKQLWCESSLIVFYTSSRKCPVKHGRTNNEIPKYLEHLSVWDQLVWLHLLQ